MKNLQTLKEEQLLLLEEIKNEYLKGFLALNDLPPKTVTFYGGGKIKKYSKTYIQAKEIAKIFAKNEWGVVSGGGPGIMSASLEGANEGGSKSIAFRIDLKEEPPYNFSDIDIVFRHFSVRKYLLRQSDILIYFPGGFGTLDELMENLTLIVTNKHPIKPIYLFDSSFWKDYIHWFENILLAERKTIIKEYTEVFKIVDNCEEIISEIFS